MPLVLLNSCIFGNKLMTVATKHRIMLNVRKNMCNPHSVFYIENKKKKLIIKDEKYNFRQEA